MDYYYQFVAATNRQKNTSFDLGILRGADTLNLQVTTNADGMFGFQNVQHFEIFEPEVIKYTFFQSIPAGIKHGVNITKSYLKQLKMLV